MVEPTERAGALRGLGRSVSDLVHSVRARILAWVILLMSLGMSGAAGVAYVLEDQRIDQRINASLQQEIREFAEFEESGIDPGTGESFASIERLLYVAMRRNVPDEHQTLAGFMPGKEPFHPLDGDLPLHFDPAFQDLVTRSDEPAYGQYESARGMVRFATMPVVQGAERGTFVVAYFAESEHAELIEVIRIYSIAAVGVLVVVGLVTWLSAGRLLRPIREVRRTAQQISETDLSLRMAETGKDDVAELARTFNAMLDRLETAFATQREFLDDAGHELRTPITIVRGHLELLDVSDPADAAETRALLLDELDRMSRLVEDLIVLAKAERPDFLQIDLVDIGRLTDDVVDKARALGNRRWRIEARTSAAVIADRHRLTQALVQLAENAVKFSGPDDEVLIGSSADGSWVRLWVRDFGPGVAPEHAERIFERFQRTEGSQRTGGSGLGLAIVRAIAEAHGGSAWVESRVGRGATFLLRIPYATVVPPAIGEPDVVFQRTGPA